MSKLGRHVRWAIGATLALAALALGGCLGGDDDDGSNASGGSSGGGDAPESITFWGRAANEAINQRLVDAYNKTHKTKVKFTVFPDDQFVTRIGTAAASNELPDVVAVDSVYMPQFIEQGLMLDITDRAQELPFFDDLSQGQMSAATGPDERVYAVPRDVDASALFWNKDLFKRAGLDPEKPPTSFDEIKGMAAKITALGGGVHGFYFAGRCAGCNAYTQLPLVWASDGEVLTEDGAPRFDSPEMNAAMSLYRDLWEHGDVARSARTDGGENWLTGFAAGKVGIQGLGGFAIQQLREQNSKLDFGVARLPGQSGGEAAFSGGDVIGVPAGAKEKDAAWDFIAWTLSDEVQVDVVAKAGGLVARTDLIENRYSEGDPQVLADNSALEVGQVPKSVVYNQLFNDPNGPYLGALTAAVFRGDVEGALKSAQEKGDEIFEGGG